ncbi:hypothetical protein AGDE_12629 [Angomonas deanei]|nr:hypothetical protein AGDE_12629 [Angomonas deanei]|eukprot:EPY23932.1 hypothetical protein AGDE_12629 [Angomonas deanei]
MSSAARESGNQTFAPVLVASVGMEEPNFLVLWELRKLRDPTRTGGTDHTWEQKYIFQPLFSLRLDTPGVFRGVSQKRQFLFLQDGRYLFCNVNDTIQVFSTEKANHGTSTWERVSDFFTRTPLSLEASRPLYHYDLLQASRLFPAEFRYQRKMNGVFTAAPSLTDVLVFYGVDVPLTATVLKEKKLLLRCITTDGVVSPVSVDLLHEGSVVFGQTSKCTLL